MAEILRDPAFAEAISRIGSAVRAGDVAPASQAADARDGGVDRSPAAPPPAAGEAATSPDTAAE